MIKNNNRPITLTYIDTYFEKDEADILDLIFNAIYVASEGGED